MACWQFGSHQTAAEADETVARDPVDHRQAGVVKVCRVDVVGEGVNCYAQRVETDGNR